MIKTYSLPHTLELGAFFDANLILMNKILADCWNHLRWVTKAIRKPRGTAIPMRQQRILPILPPSSIKKSLRQSYVREWPYSSHWVDGAIKTVWSILQSWKTNYINGHRKATKPVIKRAFVRVQSSLYRWDGNNSLRISLYPHRFIYLDLSHRHFRTGNTLGEPILTPTHIHLPFHYPDPPAPTHIMGWDSNLASLDGYSPETGWVQVSLKPLLTLHATYHHKYQQINRIYAKNKRKGQALYRKYRRRERNRVNACLHQLVQRLRVPYPLQHGFEALQKTRMGHPHARRWNQRLGRKIRRKIVTFFRNRYAVMEVSPYNTSKTCARCGCVHQDLRGEQIFECPACGVQIHRQFNAAINIYLKMNGVSPHPSWFDRVVGGGLPTIGAERSLTDELVRSGEDLMMPKQCLI